MKIQTHLIGVLEENLPLCCLTNVNTQSIIARRVGNVWKDVSIVAFNIHWDETECIHPLFRQVVDGANDTFAFPA
jgi:hypothetical protein